MHKVTIITGKKHSGKTTKMLNLLSDYKSQGKLCAGIIAIGTFKDNKRFSFYLLDIETNKSCEFMTIKQNKDYTKIGKFYINPKGLDFGAKALEKAINSKAEIVFIDEIGPLEIAGNGWAEYLKKLLKTNKQIVISIRDSLKGDVCSKFNIET